MTISTSASPRTTTHLPFDDDSNFIDSFLSRNLAHYPSTSSFDLYDATGDDKGIIFQEGEGTRSLVKVLVPVFRT